jgi:GR25 family glycosyltransferase involved in LPS biosynthesis
MNWIDKIFVINLDRSTERLKKCIKQSSKFNFRFERFPAIEGNKLTKQQLSFIHPICQHFLCTRGMMGCGLSHYFLLKKIVDEKIQTSIVLEDDFVWKQDTISKLDKIRDFNDGIVKLSCIGPFCSSNLYDQPQICPFALGNAAYLIKYPQAKQLLKHIQQIIYHIDVQFIFSNVPMYHYPCIDVDGMDDSTLGLHSSTLLSRILPISSQIKWILNEPFIAPFGYGINLFLLLSLIFIAFGIYIYNTNKWIGISFVIFGVFTILI